MKVHIPKTREKLTLAKDWTITLEASGINARLGNAYGHNLNQFGWSKGPIPNPPVTPNIDWPMKIKPEQLLTEPIGVCVETEEQMAVFVEFFPQLFNGEHSDDVDLYLNYAKAVVKQGYIPYIYLCEQNRFGGSEASWNQSANIKKLDSEYFHFIHIIFDDIEWCQRSIEIPFIL